MISLGLRCLGACMSFVVAAACGAQAASDWPAYGHDGGSSHYSALSDINAGNVSGLRRAWTFHMAPAVGANAAPQTGLAAHLRQRRGEATPLMVDGVLYMPTPYNNVIALDATTGKLIWEHKLPNGSNAGTRGLAYWPGSGTTPARVVFGTTDAMLMSLDAKTGEPSAGFGQGGSVDMKAGVSNGFANRSMSLSSPPAIYRNVIVTGMVLQESPGTGPSGDTRGWDAVTGRLLWQFHSVPHPGETGNETWETPDSWKNRSGTNVWGLITVDPETGQLFLPYGSPTSDFYGADRKGANLFGNSLVSLDAQTGKLKWYFQFVHHDTWDYDLESAPILVTIRRRSRKIPAVVATSKTGLVFILDRKTGKPIYGVTERPVPASDVPGEAGIDTQPFPNMPEPLARMSFKESDLATVTPDHKKFCEDLMHSGGGYTNQGPFTRYGLKGALVFPGTLGATNWHGGSYDPGLNYVFYNIIELADMGRDVPTGGEAAVPYQRRGPTGPYDRFWDGDKFWPCQQPP